MTPQQMLEAAEEILNSGHGETEIVRNQVGNLAVMDGEDYVAWVDVRDGNVNWLDES
jgi:hypothetical protein